MVNDYILEKVFNKIKRMGIEKLEHIKILIDTDDKLSNDIILKKALILMACVIRDGDKFYPELFLEEALSDE